MKQDKEIYEGIRRAVNDVTPDVFDKITSISLESIEDKIEEKYENNSVIQLSDIKKVNKFKRWSGVIAACIVICVSFGGVQYSKHHTIDSLVCIDVNPSIQITTNTFDKVIKIVPLNEDGNIVLNEIDVRNKDLELVISEITSSLIKNRYISKVSADMLISVKNQDADKAKNLQNMIVSDVSNTLQDNNIKGTIVSQLISPKTNTDIEKLAEKHKISYGKAYYVYNLAHKNPKISEDKVAELSISEINRIIQKIELENGSDKNVSNVFNGNVSIMKDTSKNDDDDIDDSDDERDDSDDVDDDDVDDDDSHYENNKEDEKHVENKKGDINKDKGNNINSNNIHDNEGDNDSDDYEESDDLDNDDDDSDDD